MYPRHPSGTGQLPDCGPYLQAWKCHWKGTFYQQAPRWGNLSPEPGLLLRPRKMGGELDEVISRGHFQPQTSVILWRWDMSTAGFDAPTGHSCPQELLFGLYMVSRRPAGYLKVSWKEHFRLSCRTNSRVELCDSTFWAWYLRREEIWWRLRSVGWKLRVLRCFEWEQSLLLLCETALLPLEKQRLSSPYIGTKPWIDVLLTLSHFSRQGPS